MYLFTYSLLKHMNTYCVCTENKVGGKKKPDFSDKVSLIYVVALTKRTDFTN